MQSNQGFRADPRASQENNSPTNRNPADKPAPSSRVRFGGPTPALQDRGAPPASGDRNSGGSSVRDRSPRRSEPGGNFSGSRDANLGYGQKESRDDPKRSDSDRAYGANSDRNAPVKSDYYSDRNRDQRNVNDLNKSPQSGNPSRFESSKFEIPSRALHDDGPKNFGGGQSDRKPEGFGGKNEKSWNSGRFEAARPPRDDDSDRRRGTESSYNRYSNSRDATRGYSRGPDDAGRKDNRGELDRNDTRDQGSRFPAPQPPKYSDVRDRDSRDEKQDRKPEQQEYQRQPGGTGGYLDSRSNYGEKSNYGDSRDQRAGGERTRFGTGNRGGQSSQPSVSRTEERRDNRDEKHEQRSGYGHDTRCENRSGQESKEDKDRDQRPPAVGMGTSSHVPKKSMYADHEPQRTNSVSSGSGDTVVRDEYPRKALLTTPAQKVPSATGQRLPAPHEVKLAGANQSLPDFVTQLGDQVDALLRLAGTGVGVYNVSLTMAPSKDQKTLFAASCEWIGKLEGHLGRLITEASQMMTACGKILIIQDSPVKSTQDTGIQIEKPEVVHGSCQSENMEEPVESQDKIDSEPATQQSVENEEDNLTVRDVEARDLEASMLTDSEVFDQSTDGEHETSSEDSGEERLVRVAAESENLLEKSLKKSDLPKSNSTGDCAGLLQSGETEKERSASCGPSACGLTLVRDANDLNEKPEKEKTIWDSRRETQKGLWDSCETSPNVKPSVEESKIVEVHSAEDFKAKPAVEVSSFEDPKAKLPVEEYKVVEVSTFEDTLDKIARMDKGFVQKEVNKIEEKESAGADKEDVAENPKEDPLKKGKITSLLEKLEDDVFEDEEVTRKVPGEPDSLEK